MRLSPWVLLPSHPNPSKFYCSVFHQVLTNISGWRTGISRHFPLHHSIFYWPKTPVRHPLIFVKTWWKTILVRYFENGHVPFSRILMGNPCSSPDHRDDGVYLSQARRTLQYWWSNTAVGGSIWLTIPASLGTARLIPCPPIPGYSLSGQV